MEHRHRSSDREHHGTPNDSRARGRRQPATTSRINEDHQPCTGDRPMSKPDRIRGRLPQKTLADQLSGDNDYVRRWLVQTDEEANQKRSDSHVAQQNNPNHVEPRTHVQIGLRYPALEECLKGVSSRKKRKHRSSSNSSLLEAPLGPPPQPHRGSGFKTKPPAQEEASNSPRKKRRTEASVSGGSTSSASSAPKQETFEKRARHKTREDRYEPKKKAKKRSQGREEKRPRKKKEKKGDRKRAAKKAGEDLMRNFSSKSIGQERLTIRPSQGLGLFKNGRASSPVQRRGIPDLAFSEMDFLQRSSRRVCVKDNKVSSKSREKDKRKAARAQDEISTFFKPKKPPLQSIPLNNGSGASSTYMKDRHSGNSDRIDQDYLGRDHGRSQSFDFPEKPTINFRRIGPASDIISAPVRRSPISGRPESVDDSASKLSGGAMTYISWSETQISRDAKSRDFSKVDGTRVSPSSESIRRRLENTGVFRDTGISMAARWAAVSPNAHEKPSKRDQTRTTGILARSTKTLESTRRIVSPARPRSHGLTSPYSGHQPDLREGVAPPNAKDGISKVNDGEMKRERIIIEHFDPNLGWHERQGSGGHGQEITTTTTTTTKGEVSEQSRSAPLDRHERAQMARLKRPSITVSLPRSSLAKDGAIVQNNLDGQGQTSPLVEQEPDQRTSTSELVEANSTPSSKDLNSESLPRELAQTKPNEPGQSEILSHHHHAIDNQVVFDLASATREMLAPTRPQIINAVPTDEGSSALHESTNNLHNNSSSYLGLPARGFAPGRGPLGTVHQNYHSISYQQANREPYFMHQLQRQSTPYEPTHYEDHLRRIEYEELDILTRTGATTEVEDSQYSNIPEEGFNSLYSRADDYIDNVSQHAYEGFESQVEGHREADSWDLRQAHVNIGLEHYGVEALGQESYEEGRMMEDVQWGQLFVHDYAPAEQGGGNEDYDLSSDDQTQVFWRPHHPY